MCWTPRSSASQPPCCWGGSRWPRCGAANAGHTGCCCPAARWWRRWRRRRRWPCSPAGSHCPVRAAPPVAADSVGNRSPSAWRRGDSACGSPGRLPSPPVSSTPVAPTPVDPTPQRPPSHRRRDAVTALVWLILAIGGGACGALVFDRVSSATDPAPGSESQRARRALEAATGEGDTILAVLTGTPPEATGALADRLRQVPGVHRVRSSNNRDLPPPDGGGTTLAVGIRAGLTDKQTNATVDAVRREFAGLPAGRAVVGGYPVFDRDLGLMAKADLARAEAIALPIVLILLAFAVRSAIGSVLGLALVATTVTGGLAVLLALSAVTEVS